MDIRNKDINLLVTFHAVYQELNVSRAAERLAISQPALSQRLNKLRSEIGDPLFVKTQRGLTSTPKAHELAPKIAQLVDKLEAFYLDLDEQEFLHREDRIVIYSTDYMEQRLLPTLLPYVQEHAPNLSLVFKNTMGRLPRSELENGLCDIAIAGFYSDLPDSFRTQYLDTETFKVLVDRSNSIVGDQLDLESYLRCHHLVTTLTGDLNGNIDKALKRMGKKRNVIAGVSSFLSPASVVVHSDLVVTCLGTIAEKACELYPSLQVHSLPLPDQSIRINQIWHERTQNDPLRQWLRAQIKDLI